MPAVPRRPTRPRLVRRLAAAAGVLLAAAVLASAQPADPPKAGPTPDPTRAGAVKLPDGTVVFFTKNPDEANPPIDGVLLSPQEYKALLDQADQLKRFKDAPRPQAPSECQVRGKVEPRGDRAVAALTLTYSFRTTAPRSSVALGGQKAFPVAARLAGGKLPVLSATDDGLTALIDAPGEHTLSLDVEAPVAPRGAKGELGFELGLPRAAITTLALDPPAGAKKLTVGVRTAGDRAGELKQTTEDAAALAPKAGRPAYPLGPAELLAVSWQPPTATPGVTAAVLSADLDVAVRVDEAQVETTAAVRLHGPAREWSVVLPAGADVSARPATPAAPRDPDADPALPPADTPPLTRPTDPAHPVWTFRPPEGPGPDWVLTAVVRQPRAGHRGPFPVGPFAVPTAARQAGTVRVYAPPAVLLDFKRGPGVRRQDAPPPEDDLVAAFKFTAAGPPPKRPPAPLLELDARPARTFTRVQPSYTLRRTDAGWRLETELAVTPFRTEVDRVAVDVPDGWQGVEAGPLELVEGVEELPDAGAGRRYAVRLFGPQRGAFTLTLTATFPVALTAKEASLPLPRFPGSVEGVARVTAVVPEKLEVHGTATGTDGESRELKPASAGAKSAAVTAVTGQFDKGAARVDLGWQVYRPELTADVRAEVRLGDHQVGVTQTIRFRSADGNPRPGIRLFGPVGATGLRANPGSPPVDPSGPGEWGFRPPADGAREFTLSVSYALPLPRSPDQAGPARLPVGLLWPDAATRVETTLRVWGAGSDRRVARFEGPWRELPPEPGPDAFPWLTLAGTGNNLPLSLELTDRAAGVVPAAVVERALVQAWLSDDGALAVRGRFRLARWPAAGVDVELPPGVVPEITVDGKKTDPVPRGPGESAVRVPVPDYRAGRSVLLDVRYLLPPARSPYELTVPPPRLPGAVLRSPARWQVVLPPGNVPLYLGRDLQPDVRWGWRHRLFAPAAASSTDDLEQWITEGTEPDADDDPPAATAGPTGDALTARQPAPGPVRLVRVARGWFVAACSLAAFVVGYAASRLRSGLLGPALGAVGVAAAVLAAGWPQPTAQAAGAAEPGLLGLAVALLGAAAVRWYYRRRVAYLPGFTRGPAVSVGSGSGQVAPPPEPRSSQTGSVVAALDGTASHQQPAPSGS